MSSQNWVKHGLIYNRRAQCPTVLKLGDVWRVFFADRDHLNRTFIRYVDLNPDNPKEILYEEHKSILSLGEPGTFDHYGVMPTFIFQNRDSTSAYFGQFCMYYIGWGQRLDVPYQNSIGLATSTDGKTFTKAHVGPVIGVSTTDPYFTGTACIIPTENQWLCYYLSCTGWSRCPDTQKLEPRYHIKGASGKNDKWCSFGTIIDYKDGDEGGICSATVFIDSSCNHHMWYCYRSTFGYRDSIDKSYRIGYARASKDNVTFERLDELVNFRVEVEEWESQMQCYPYIIEHNDELYMFYNGNNFGGTGFGLSTISMDDIRTKTPDV